jgi:hypothetical protein
MRLATTQTTLLSAHTATPKAGKEHWEGGPHQSGARLDSGTRRRGGRMTPRRKKALELASLAAQESGGHETTVGTLDQQ